MSSHTKYSGRWDAAVVFSAKTKGGKAILKHWFREKYFKYVIAEEIGGDKWDDWFIRAATEMPWGYVLQFGCIWWRTKTTGFIQANGDNVDDDCIWLESLMDEYIDQFSVNDLQEDYGLEFMLTPTDTGWHEVKAQKRKPPEPIVKKLGASYEFLSMRMSPTIVINDKQVPDTAGVIWEAGVAQYDDRRCAKKVAGGKVIGSRTWKKIID